MNYIELQELLTQANFEISNSNYAEAELLADKILAVTESDSSIYIEALLILATAARQRKHLDIAFTWAENALSLSYEHKDINNTATALYILGTINQFAYNFEKALEYFEKALLLSEENELQAVIAKVCAGIGLVHLNLGANSLSLEYLQKALKLYEQLDDKSDITNTIGNIAIIYKRLGLMDKALECSKKALVESEKLGRKSDIARNLLNLGNLFERMGIYDSALDCYTKSLELYEQTGEKSKSADAIGNIGLIYFLLNNSTMALEYYAKALVIYEKFDEKFGIAYITRQIGMVYISLEQYDRALECFFKSLMFHEEIGRKSGMAVALLSIGNVYYALNSFEKALEYYTRTISLCEETGEKSGIAVCIMNIGIIYSNNMFDGYDAQKAEECLLNAIALNEELCTKQALLESHQAIAELYRLEGRWEKHALHLKKFYEMEKEVQCEEVQKQVQKYEYERKIAAEHARLEEREKIVQELTALNATLAEANREKNEIIGIVAHDLKNPLSGILLSVETVQRFYRRFSSEEVEKRLGLAMSAAKHMQTIVMNLLDIQLIESGQLNLNIQPVILNQLIETVIVDYVEQASAKNINVNTSLPKQELICMADPLAMREVVDNLISNAIKFSNSGTQIFVGVELKSDNCVHISIKDQGPGLTEEDFLKLFGRFTRLSAKPTAGEHSTGLGLSIVKKLVESMNGRIWCESKVGQGATFKVEFQCVA